MEVFQNERAFCTIYMQCNVYIKSVLFVLDIRVRDCGGGYSNHGYQVQDIHTWST